MSTNVCQAITMSFCQTTVFFMSIIYAHCLPPSAKKSFFKKKKFLTAETVVKTTLFKIFFLDHFYILFPNINRNI